MRSLLFVPVLLCSAVSHAAALSLAPCNITGLTEPARCGALDVPENPKLPNGRHLSIGVVVVPATAAPVRPDPIAFLPGGPGESIIEEAAHFAAPRRMLELP